MEVEPLPVDPDIEPRKTNREPLPLSVKLLWGGAVLLAVGTAFFLRGNATHFLVFVSFFCLVVIGSALAAIIAGVVHWRRGQEQDVGIWPKVVSGLIAIVFACGLQLMGYGIGEGLAEHDIRSAQRFVLGLVPDLDRVHKETGRYPESLKTVVPPDAEIPRLVDLDEVYDVSPDGQRFAFLLYDPREMFFGGFRWSSGERLWRNWDG